MIFSNPRLKLCVELTMKEIDLRQRRVKLLQLLGLVDATTETLAKQGLKPSEGLREDRAQLVRLLNQVNEFLESREAL